MTDHWEESNNPDTQNDDEDEEEEEEDNELVAVHRRYIPETVKVLNALAKLEKAGMSVNTILNLGAGGAPTVLLLMIQRQFKRVWAVSDEQPEYSLWWDSEEWLEITGKDSDVKYIEANIFDYTDMKKRLGKQQFDIGYLHQTLHHLRTMNCQWEPTGENGNRSCGNPPGDQPIPCSYEECDRAVGNFNPNEVFEVLFRYCDTVLVSEDFYAGEDTDKENAQGGILTRAERHDCLEHLLERTGYIRFFHPENKKIGSPRQLKNFFRKLDMAPYWMFAVTKPVHDK